MVIGLVWLAICVIQLGAMLSDARVEDAAALARAIARTLLANGPLAIYCVMQYLWFSRAPVLTVGGRRIARAYVVSTLVFLVPYGAFESLINPVILGDQPWANAPGLIAQYPALYWSFDLLLVTGCFSATLAANIWRNHRAAENAHHAAARENLSLRLALEQQQLRSLQAQLEPHFLFNALNAISALVRGERTRDAMAAIGTLSALLRHAISASHSPWSTLGREFNFIRDYLGLQRLRFGDRLVLDIGELTEELAGVEVPALIVQPLVENAIRHDVERHGTTTTLRVAAALHREDRQVVIRVENPLHDTLPANPGSGLGLANVRERLALLCGSQARCEVSSAQGRFVATIVLPLERHD